MVRICPKCKEKLGSLDFYFCGNCGSALPEEFKSARVLHKRVLTPDLKKSDENLGIQLKEVFQRVSHILNVKQILVLFLGLAVIGIPAYFGYKYFSSRSSGLTINPNVQRNISSDSRNSFSLDVPLKAHLFGSDKITEIIPEDIDIYFEAHDFEGFSKLFSRFDSYYYEITEKLREVAGDHFSVIAKVKDENDLSWALVMLPTEAGEDNNNVEFEDFEWVKTEIVGNFLVVANDQELVEAIKATKNKTTKSLEQNTSYASVKNTMPKSGKIKILVFSKNGEEYVNYLTKAGLEDDLEMILESFRNSGLKFAVIL